MGPSFRSGRPTAARSAFSRTATCGASTCLERRPSSLRARWIREAARGMPTGRLCSVPTSVGPLHQVSASGGTPAPLTTLSTGETSHRWPEFLPDGRTLLYYVQGTSPASISRRSTGRATRGACRTPSDARYVPGQGNGPGYLLWVARDTVMAQPFDPRLRSSWDRSWRCLARRTLPRPPRRTVRACRCRTTARCCTAQGGPATIEVVWT